MSVFASREETNVSPSLLLSPESELDVFTLFMLITEEIAFLISLPIDSETLDRKLIPREEGKTVSSSWSETRQVSHERHSSKVLIGERLPGSN